MSKKYGIFCENCNVLLNNEDNIFGTNFGHLYHSTCMGGITHGKSTDCQPLTLFRMNLKFADTPTIITEAEGEIMELKIKKFNNTARQHVQQLEAKIKTLEDALLVKNRLKDDVNKLMDCVADLANTLSINVIDKASDIVNNTSQDKSNKQAYDENNLNGDDSSLTEEAEEQNIEHNNSNNGMLQSVQQLESRIKTLEDALLQTKSDGNKLTDCVQALEKSKAVDNATDGGNNKTQDSNANKRTHIESDLSGEQHNDTENVASASEEHHTCTISEEKQEVLDLRRNCVLIQNPKSYSPSLDEAFSYVRALANEMNAQIADNSVIHIDMDGCRNWYVYFRDADNKKEFLKNRLIFKYNPNTEDYLRILDYSDCSIVNINNFQSSDLSLETAFVKVDELAKKMGMINIRNFIDHIDVYAEPNIFSIMIYNRGHNLHTPDQIIYSVRFNCQDKKTEFLKHKDVLKKFRETKSLEFTDVGGHTSSQYTLNNCRMDIASANVIGVAELIGLSLSTDNVKRIYVLNAKKFYPSAGDVHSSVVEFSSNDIKIQFLKKTCELIPFGKRYRSYISISDTKTEMNSVSIKYKPWAYMFTAISFIGLAKQLGFSFNPDQTDRFIKLSEFISEASS